MKNDGHEFLSGLVDSTPETFEGRFEKVARQLRAESWFSRDEFSLLHEAALNAVLCNAVLNGAGESGAAPHDGARCRHARHLELAFLEARDVLFASPGWQALPSVDQDRIEQACVLVRVADRNLLW